MKRPTINSNNFSMPNPDDFIDKKPIFSSFIEDKKEPKKKGQKKQVSLHLSNENYLKLKNYCIKNNFTQSELIEAYISNLKL